MSVLNLIYFSAAGTTQKVVRAIADGIDIPVGFEHNVLMHGAVGRVIGMDDVTVFGVPVYSGRIPASVRSSLKTLVGHQSSAIIACVYGNRDYDDALLELKDLVENLDFRVVSAGAFVAEHSLFPAIATGRPDAGDVALARSFGAKSLARVAKLTDRHEVAVPGNRPYRPRIGIPFVPLTSKTCNSCGLCAAQCPVHAIDSGKLKHVDKHKCLRCGHCVAICPQRAKHFGGVVYRMAERAIEKRCEGRKEPFFVY